MKKILISAILALSLFGTVATAEVNLKACTSCHGADWSKKALGKSKDVSKMSGDEISAALIGYKDGTYGGSMKGLMKGQVSKYTKHELDASAIKIKTK